MKLVIGVITEEDFETGERKETYNVVYETKTKSRQLEVLKWFASSKYKKLMVVPDKVYKRRDTLRSSFAERMGFFVQPDDCFVAVTQKFGRVFLEKI